MRKIISLVFAVGIVFGLADGVMAQRSNRNGTRPASVNQRQNRQQHRIGHGIVNGELTRREAFRLEREQFQINRLERRVRADDEVTRRERARLQRELNEASRHIYRAKHNERDRN